MSTQYAEPSSLKGLKIIYATGSKKSKKIAGFVLPAGSELIKHDILCYLIL